MTLENQVTSLELSKRLKELGVRQESHFIWSNYNFEDEVGAFVGFDKGVDRWVVSTSEEDDGISAFTASELGEMLMDGRLTQYCFKQTPGWGWKSFTLLGTPVVFTEYSNTEADARAKLLIYLLENNFLTL